MITLVVTLLACSPEDNALAPDFDGTAAEDAEPGTLRVDVLPAADGGALLPQSFILPPGTYEGTVNEHDLHATAAVTGRLTAESMQGFANAASRVGPLAGVVRASRTGRLQGGAVQTDENGSFVLPLPSGQNYTFEVLPTDATQSPFVYVPAQAVPEAGLTMDELVGLGAPVYGRVTDASGARLAYAPLHLRRLDADVRSATFTTDEDGWYVAHVEPGYEYALVVEGGSDEAGVPFPSVEVPFLVENEDGAQVDLEVGARRKVELSAWFVDGGGERLREPGVRASSQSLATGTLVIEQTGDSEGNVLLNLLPGTWTLEVWPTHERQLGQTPWRITDLVVDDDTERGREALLAPTDVSGTVRDADGSPVPGATVSATELGGGGYIYSTTTDAQGAYELEVPRTQVRLQVVPADESQGATTHEEVDLATAGEAASRDLMLVAGSILTGRAQLGDEAVPYAVIEVYDQVAGLLLGRTITDGDGNYALRVAIPEPAPIDDGADTGDDAGGDTGDADTGEPADTGDVVDTGDTADTAG